ncbi:phosphoesterase [Candidatus Koribacter versatilis Ellin345]|uniref:Phosphoesterase n=1 Tax=Koribacter versatilis (strain Ellin345) TaxID=204669 RepID=Q1IQN3_KORVE|nr:phosphoesterase [Candidatus Koribacter versatilis]ABF40817.1 phosphoesterase [Candidatus Koribacter versatilis Ellin345]
MRSLRLGSILLCLLSLAGCRGIDLINQAPAPLKPIKPATHKVVLVVLENQRYQAIIGNAHAPYLNRLANEYAVAQNFYADVHPSIGNYFMLTVGSSVTNDLNFAQKVSDDNLAREMGQAAMGWKAYLESIPRVGYHGDGPYPYAKTHNPYAYFTDIAQYHFEANNMVGLDQYTADVTSDSLPSFALLIPDQTHNMHDCGGGGRNCTNDDKVAAGDAWLQTNLDPLFNTTSFQSGNTLLIITWDESWDNDNDHGGGHVPVIVIGKNVKPHYASTTFYQHESVLRLICEYLGLKNDLSKAANAPDMQEFFSDPGTDY